MKNFSWTRRIVSILSIVALVAAVGLLMTDCEDELPEKQIKGTVTANSEGKILFEYSRNNSEYSESCTFTTNLQEPDNVFVLVVTEGVTTAKKEIDDLEPGQIVEWTATAQGKPLNHGSGHFVHIVNN